MAKTKIILYSLVVFIALGCSENFQYKWKRTTLDASRTGVSPVIDDVDAALGVIKDSSYIAPNGAIYYGRTKDVASLLISYQDKMDRVKEVIAHSSEYYSTHYPESELSNLLVDQLMLSVAKSSGKKIDVGLANFGGIRADLPKGDIILDDMLSMFPFKNKTVYLEIKGSDLKVMLENFAKSRFEVLGGMKILARGGKLISCEIGGQPLDENKTYSMATIDFLYKGGDGIKLKDVAMNVEGYEVNIIDFMLEYILAQTEAGNEISYKKDGRVVIERALVAKAESEAVVDRKPILTIVHFNDTHSHFETERAGKNRGKGGIIERAAYIDSVSQSVGADSLLFLHAGDFCQGSSYFTELKGEAEIEFLNALGYDAVCLGNHEFDNGIDELAKHLKSLKMPILCANYDFSGTPLEEVVKPYAIIRKAGLKIGVIGALDNLNSLVDVDIVSNIKFIDPAQIVNEHAKYLKTQEGCDLIICLSHLGYDDDKYSDIELAKASSDLDIIVGGHTHTNLKEIDVVDNKLGEPVQIVTSWKWGLVAGELKIYEN